LLAWGFPAGAFELWLLSCCASDWLAFGAVLLELAT